MALVVMMAPRLTLAHEGHDHDKPPPLALPIAQRVVAVTPDYELVGVLSGQSRLTIFLTDYATNAPVKADSLSVEANAQRVQAQSKGDGVFEINAPWLASNEGLDLTFHLTVGSTHDLLTGLLEARPGPMAHPATALDATPWPGAKTALPFLAGVIAGALATLLLRPGRRSFPSNPHSAEALPTAAEARSQSSGVKPLRRSVGALLAVFAVSSFLIPDPAMAADTAATANSPAPSSMATDLAQRLPDGTLFVPKATQFLLSVRTQVVAESGAATSKELPGTIIVAPNNFGRVQSGHSGRLEAPKSGLGFVGQRVKKGDLLGYLTPHIDTVERGKLESQLAETDARIEAQVVRLARLRTAPLAVPPIKIEEAEGELAALKERRRQLNPTLTERHEIYAPVSGVVSKAGYFAGQVIEPHDVLFEIVDPSEFWVEAMAYAAPNLDSLEQASAVIGENETAPLEFIGRGLALKEQAVPLLFKLKGPTARLSIGQPVKVVLQFKDKANGFVVPSSSVVRTENGLSAVWIKSEAERFEPQIVKFEPLDGRNVVVTAGLKPDARIVTEGATLLNQVR